MKDVIGSIALEGDHLIFKDFRLAKKVQPNVIQAFEMDMLDAFYMECRRRILHGNPDPRIGKLS